MTLPILKPVPREPRPRKPLKSSGFLPRTESLPPCNRKRKAKAFARNFHSAAFVEFTRRQPCAICGEAPRRHWQREDRWGNECAHVRSRGAGGDFTLIIACCPSCHDAGKPTGKFALAREHMRRWQAEQSLATLALR